MIVEGQNTVNWEKYSVQPANNIVVPCSDIEAQPNSQGSPSWIFGALENSGSQYEYISDYYAEYPSPAPATGYFGYSENALEGDCATEQNISIEYEPLQTYHMVLLYNYECDGGGTCQQEEWHAINTTGAVEYAYALILIAFVFYGFFKLVNSIVYHDTNS